MAIEIVDFPIKIWWFSIAMLIHQRVPIFRETNISSLVHGEGVVSTWDWTLGACFRPSEPARFTNGIPTWKTTSDSRVKVMDTRELGPRTAQPDSESVQGPPPCDRKTCKPSSYAYWLLPGGRPRGTRARDNNKHGLKRDTLFFLRSFH